MLKYTCSTNTFQPLQKNFQGQQNTTHCYTLDWTRTRTQTKRKSRERDFFCPFAPFPLIWFSVKGLGCALGLSPPLSTPAVRFLSVTRTRSSERKKRDFLLLFPLIWLSVKRSGSTAPKGYVSIALLWPPSWLCTPLFNPLYCLSFCTVSWLLHALYGSLFRENMALPKYQFLAFRASGLFPRTTIPPKTVGTISSAFSDVVHFLYLLC